MTPKDLRDRYTPEQYIALCDCGVLLTEENIGNGHCPDCLNELYDPTFMYEHQSALAGFEYL